MKRSVFGDAEIFLVGYRANAPTVRNLASPFVVTSFGFSPCVEGSG
jgi:hypothetical protein